MIDDFVAMTSDYSSLLITIKFHEHEIDQH